MACATIVAGAVGSGVPPAPTADSGVSVAAIADAVRAVAQSGDPEFGPLTPAELDELSAVYAPPNFATLWVDADGRPSHNARAALALLAGAVDHGLDPDDYRADRLAHLSATLDVVRPRVAKDIATFDAALSANTLRFLRHLHTGRVDPRALGFRMSTPVDDHDFVAILRSAVAGDRVAETAAEWEPPLDLYRGLRRALAQYRALAADPAIQPVPPDTTKPVHPGEPYAGVRMLRQRLIALGDVPADAPESDASTVYGEPLIDGVRAFQARHGLLADGVIGPRTQAALRVPIARRVRQIELALERVRWLPDLADRFLAVNIPMFHLWGWDAIRPDGVPSFDMGVIVGNALNTQTPVFVEEMRYIIFRPYWNVPPSIVRQEILPALARDPEYLTKHDMEIVSGQSDAARPVETTADAVARLRSGSLRVRQRPGPANSLGLLKFIFPNDDNVYLHGTAAPHLFSRPRRDFSHGCVRVQDPQMLAAWALADRPEWTRARIRAAMQAATPSRVDLTRPIQVILFYLTAVVLPQDGSVRFAEDIYGHDATLERALARRGQAR